MAVSYRYYRFKGIQLSGSLLEIAEFQITNNGTRVIQTTQSSSNTPDYGNVNDSLDGSLSTRCYWVDTTVETATFWIKLDFGTSTTATGFKLGGFDNSTRYPSCIIVEGSNDDTTWYQLAFITDLIYPGNNTLSAEYPLSNTGILALLLHCNGTNGSTTFTDNSTSSKTVTAYGNAQISTTQSKFGGASGYFDGTGDYLSIPYDSSLNVGDKLICDAVSGEVELQVYPTGYGSPRSHIIGRWASSQGWTLDIDSSGHLVLASQGVTAGSTTATVPLNQWTHVAIVFYYASGTNKADIYINGTLDVTLDHSSNPIGQGIYIGQRSDGTLPFQGYIDEFRIVQGERVYTSNFTPPTSEFTGAASATTITTSADAKLLKQGVIKTSTIDSRLLKQALTNNTGLDSVLFRRYTAVNSLDSILAKLYLKSAGFDAYLERFAEDVFLDSRLQKSDILKTISADSFLARLGITVATGFDANLINRRFKTLSFDAVLSYWYDVAIAIPEQWISTHYRCYLTGDLDGLGDLELPISSFSIRMGASPYRAYMSVIVPGIDAYIAGIELRPNGKIQVERIYNYSDSSMVTVRMCKVNVDNLSTNQGAKSGTTGTISGYEQLTPALSETVQLFDPITKSVDNGRRRYRCRIDPRLRPLDTVIINGESFVVDGIAINIDSKTALMDISELV